MLIYVEDLHRVASAVEICSKERADMVQIIRAENAADDLIGRAISCLHELIHGMRIATTLARVRDSLTWIRNDRSDWCITLREAID